MPELLITHEGLRAVESRLSEVASELGGLAAMDFGDGLLAASMPGAAGSATVSNAVESTDTRIRDLSIATDETSDDCQRVADDFAHVDAAFADAFHTKVNS
ncbi:hypothetical protein [Gulosibacter bifidus]|uniref:Uncharacterized protein n=1 Tax=Gulosibacter bifidus TaxID=272239 RepID=A0ABW5RJY6_9MICO